MAILLCCCHAHMAFPILPFSINTCAGLARAMLNHMIFMLVMWLGRLGSSTRAPAQHWMERAGSNGEFVMWSYPQPFLFPQPALEASHGTRRLTCHALLLGLLAWRQIGLLEEKGEPGHNEGRWPNQWRCCPQRTPITCIVGPSRGTSFFAGSSPQKTATLHFLVLLLKGTVPWSRAKRPGFGEQTHRETDSAMGFVVGLPPLLTHSKCTDPQPKSCWAVLIRGVLSDSPKLIHFAPENRLVHFCSQTFLGAEMQLQGIPPHTSHESLSPGEN